MKTAGNILGSKFFSSLVSGKGGSIPRSNTGSELYGVISNFFKGEYSKAVGRKAESDYHSLMSGGDF